MKPRRTWLLFGLCFAVVLAMMAWVSATAVRADRSHRRAAQQVVHEEQIRLALWRMDSTLTPLLASEVGRAHAEYLRGDIPVSDEETLLYFRSVAGQPVDVVGAAASVDREAFVQAFSHEQVVAALASRSGRDTGVDGGEPDPSRAPNEGLALGVSVDEQQAAQNVVVSKSASQRSQPRVQQQLNMNEWDKRVDNYRNSLSKYSGGGLGNDGFDSSLSGTGSGLPPVDRGSSFGWKPPEMMQAIWVDGRLLLVRRVDEGSSEQVEGCWLDWEHIEVGLLRDIADLLDTPRLEIVGSERFGGGERMLATLPVRLEPGPVPEDEDGGWSALRLSLVVAWICVLLAAGAVLALLMASMTLSERRGAFVSAVTHELRTPLTTFRIYTEMLSEGMVDDPDKRQRYLDTLRREADRLGVLVENVLAYAKIEGEVPEGRLREIGVDEFVSGIEERLRERAAQADMELVVDIPESTGAVSLRVDPSAAEQILFNLVDNAAKYATSAYDRRIHLEASTDAKVVRLRVRDHGPGISPDERRKVFEPFAKAARDESGHAPGVGLGLALSRGLARQMGGDLRIESASEGACFEVTVQRFTPAST